MRDVRKRNAAAAEALPGHGKAIGRLPLSRQVPVVPPSWRRVACISYVSRSLANRLSRWRRCWLRRGCLAEVVLRGDRRCRGCGWPAGAVAGTEGAAQRGRGIRGPGRLASRGSGAAAGGGGPRVALRNRGCVRAVMRAAGGRGGRTGPLALCGQVRGTAVAAGGARAEERAADGTGGRAAAGRTSRRSTRPNPGRPANARPLGSPPVRAARDREDFLALSR